MPILLPLISAAVTLCVVWVASLLGPADPSPSQRDGGTSLTTGAS